MHDPTAPVPGQPLPVRFTGSGSEYFRIWIVNVLLTIVTLSLYHPFAKARRLAYFYGNTRVGGEALAFRGNPRKMLRGYLLVVLAWAGYLLASRFNPPVGAALGLLFLGLWPALWRAGLQFRLGNTSWRGVRLRFEGSLAGAYRAWAPLMLPLAPLIAASALIPQAPDEARAVPIGLALLPLAAMLALLLLGPWWMAATMRYRQAHSAWAAERAALDAGPRAFYAGAARLAGLALLVAGVGFGAAVWAARTAAPGEGPPLAVALWMVLTYLALLAGVWPYASARLQDLVWGRTASAHLRFHCRLPARRLAVVSATNLLLTVLTLGLYRPFAAVRMARLRLEAVSVEFLGDAQAWDGLAATQDDAAGDFAGDFFGIDFGI